METCSLLECEQFRPNSMNVNEGDNEVGILSPFGSSSTNIDSYHDLMQASYISLSDDVCRVFKNWEPFLEWETANQLLSEPATVIGLCQEHTIALRAFNESIGYDSLFLDEPEFLSPFSFALFPEKE